MGKLLDAGMRVFADRGYHAARVDDIVRAARTSHGTFYLYFASKEDLLRALAVECAQEWTELAGAVGPVGRDESGFEELRRFLGAFLDTYRRYGPIIRAWREAQGEDREIGRLGVRSFTAIASTLASRMDDAGAPHAVDSTTSVAALMAMLDSLARVVHRGFFGGAAEATIAG
jgi:AcrR family transcriptional regulator